MLESIFSEAVATISTESCLISMGVAIIVGVVIALAHKFTTKTTNNFLITVAILPLLAQIVIILINGNLGTSLAVAGAFTLVRFRSMQGNSKEIITIFWAMAMGLALGMGYVVFTVVATLVVAVLVLIYNKIAIKLENGSNRKLKVVIPENLDYNEVLDDIFEKYTEKVELNKVKTTNMGSTFELSYAVVVKKGINEKHFLDAIRTRNANMLVMLEREGISEEEL